MAKTNFNACVCLLGLSLCVVLSGCGRKGDFDTAAVEGTITTDDGTVVESGKIKFSPTAVGEESKSGKPAIGRIKDGAFVMTTYGNNDGAVIGEHEIFLSEAKVGGQPVVISPETKMVNVKEGSNSFELKAVPSQRRRGGDDEDDD